MLTRRRGAVALIAVLGLVIGAALWLARGMSASPGSHPASGTSRTTALENSLRAIAEGDRVAPRDRWDPAYVVAHVGRHPDTLRAWVRQNTGWVPYRGSLRGATGVLMDRRGNGLDRALLLATLLKEAGHEARLARAELPADEASAMLPAVIESPPDLSGLLAEMPADSPSFLRVAAERHQLDTAAIVRTITRHAEGTARLLNELDQRTGRQVERLLAAVRVAEAADEWLVRHDSALAALRDHWWAQVRQGDAWVDLDLLSDSLPAHRIPLETFRSADLPPSLNHEVVIRVVAERLTDGTLSEARALEHTLHPAATIGRPVVLQLWPTRWPAEPESRSDVGRLMRRLALAQDQWRALLVIGDDEVASVTVDASRSDSAAAPGPMGGLGRSMALALRPPVGRDTVENAVLTAAWLEYEIRVPGRMPRKVRRTVFDLIGSAARETRRPAEVPMLTEEQRLARGFALMMRTEILLLPAQPAAEFLLHLAARSFTANADLLRAAAQPDFGSDRRLADSLVRAGQPGLGPLHVLAVLRAEALGGTAFIDRPLVLTRHQYPAVRDGDVTVADALDIVTNEVNVVLTEPNGWSARLAQGVWDTNLEALLAPGGTAAGNTALAYGDSDGWQVLTAASGRDVTAWPDDERIRLQQELEAGYTVVARPQLPAWWRIDPASGDALGIGSNGWGQNVDYGMLVGAFWEMAKHFVFAYALCQFVPQAANSLNILGHEFWELGLHPSWVKQPPREPGKDFEDVAMENHRTCVRAAIIGGLVATAPILLMVIRAELAVARMEASLARRPPGEFWNRLAAGRSGGGDGPWLARGSRGTPPIAGGRPPTGPGVRPPPPAPPRPPTGPPLPPKLDRYRAAEGEAREAGKAAAEARGEWIRYRATKPNPGRGVTGDPNWSHEKADELLANAEAARKEWLATEQTLKEARGALPKPTGTSGLGAAFQKPPAAPPQPVGNDNPTQPQLDAADRGVAGHAGLLGGE